MLRNALILCIIATSFAIACKPTPEQSSPEPTESTPQTTSPQEQHDTETEQNLTPAQTIAQKVFIAHGGPAFADIKELEFTFDVQNDSTSTFAAKHIWNLTDGTDRIQWTTPDSDRIDLQLDLEKKSVEGTVNDQPITSSLHDALAADAYRRWVNDTYWLLMPLKLQDPGVILNLEAPRTVDTKTYEVLHMTFENVGITPGDQYWIFIDPSTNQVARWDMLLEGQKTEPTTVLWENYQTIGPLTLPTTRSWPGDSKQIVFENTRIDIDN